MNVFFGGTVVSVLVGEVSAQCAYFDWNPRPISEQAFDMGARHFESFEDPPSSLPHHMKQPTGRPSYISTAMAVCFSPQVLDLTQHYSAARAWPPAQALDIC